MEGVQDSALVPCYEDSQLNSLPPTQTLPGLVYKAGDPSITTRLVWWVRLDHGRTPSFRSEVV